jgi:catechol 2,3-dioxygenase-like lactoylglutathione lyase family enzyme
MASQIVVPVFPTRSLKATLEFYNLLGFETLWEQHAPYVYVSVKYQQIQIDFVGSKAVEAGQESGHLCLVIVEDVHELHRYFAAAIKQKFGKQLRSGIPRMGTVNTVSKDQRFNLLDPDGKRLIVIQPDKGEMRPRRRSTPLLKAVNRARLDIYSRDEPQEAAAYRDTALLQLNGEPSVTQFRAFVLRADIAAALDDIPTMDRYVNAAHTIVLSADEQAEAIEEIRRLAELKN